MRARLGELEGCWLEVRCGCPRGVTLIPLKLLAQRHGPGQPLGAVLSRLACKSCNGRPAEAHLNETHNRQRHGGAEPGWSVQLVPGQKF